jgi:phosphomevalonate kinase
MDRALSAPGKLFVSGEYAVLWGGVARIAAIGPRLSAVVRRREDREVHVVLQEGRLTGMLTPLGVNWHGEVPAGFKFAARAIDIVARLHGREELGFSLAIAPSFTAPGGRKLGMGGSARACLLATEATRFVLGVRADTLKIALHAHFSAQNGKGSGADIAAIFAGGLIRYRRFEVEKLEGDPQGLLHALEVSPAVDLWRVPIERVHLTYAFAGESASTTQLIARAESRLSEAQRDAFVLDSDALGESLEEALRRDDFEGVRAAVPELQRLLRTLGPIETESTSRALAIAQSYGAAGKISGAGGGDGVLLFSPDPEAQRSLIDGLTLRGFLALPLALEPGLRGEAMADPQLAGWL